MYLSGRQTALNDVKIVYTFADFTKSYRQADICSELFPGPWEGQCQGGVWELHFIGLLVRLP